MIQRRRLLKTSLAALGSVAATRLSFAAVQRAGLGAQQSAAHALNRLGFGPRPGDIAAVAQDPAAWIAQQLSPASLSLPATLLARLDEARLTDTDPTTAIREYRQYLRESNIAANAAPNAQPNPAPEMQPDAQRRDVNPLQRYVRSLQRPAIESRLFRALESPRQLEEAMVDFWFNHFNVFQAKQFNRVLVGHYEHHAIRPHALGRFRDLLGATAHHPAMLFYLDNSSSVGPQAESRGRGLNENYARELMELHTLGVDGGYTQADVTQLARMLTGWTLQLPGGTARNFGQAESPMPGFLFNARLHDNGDKVWLGQRVTARGKAEGDHALDVLAAHPETARRIGFKLAQYFVSDQPPRALVERLAQVFLAQDGQIVPVLRALFASDEFWSPEHVAAKFKTPYHYVLSTLRAGAWSVASGVPLAARLAVQGMPLYGCQTPDGYKNTESAWLSADAMAKRLDFASQVAAGRIGQERLLGGLNAQTLMAQLGPLVTPDTRAVVARHADDPTMSVALVLAGPGMMRR